jgi:hypothetical protein
VAEGDGGGDCGGRRSGRGRRTGRGGVTRMGVGGLVDGH